MYDLLLKGGALIYPILFCSVLALAIFLQRYYTYYRFQSGNRELNDKLQPLIQVSPGAMLFSWPPPWL